MAVTAAGTAAVTVAVTAVMADGCSGCLGSGAVSEEED